MLVSTVQQSESVIQIHISTLLFILFLAALGLRCGAWASHCSGFFRCGARALGARASVVAARGLSSRGTWA